MKGATIGHAKQRIRNGRYIGITEPGIIAAESPNPIVNSLVIMPDMEKRLEAFVRVGHGIVVFPGGVGTAEEILYLLGVLLHPDNAELPMPMIMTGPKSRLRDVLPARSTISSVQDTRQARRRSTVFKIIVDDPVDGRARDEARCSKKVLAFRTRKGRRLLLQLASQNRTRTFQLPFVGNSRIDEPTSTYQRGPAGRTCSRQICGESSQALFPATCARTPPEQIETTTARSRSMVRRASCRLLDEFAGGLRRSEAA